MAVKSSLLLLSVVALTGVLALFALRDVRLSVSPGDRYEQVALDIRDYDLFDIGVADVNDDGLLDLFTANHSAGQALLINDGERGFTDALSRLGLDQDSQFPGLEDSLDAPAIAAPGLYIYRQDRWLFLQAHKIDENGPVRGHISIPWPVVVSEAPAGTEIRQLAANTGVPASMVQFVLSGNQVLLLNGAEDIVEIPHRVELDAGFSLDNVYVGRTLTNPDTRTFEMLWRDRHGMAWADYDGDDVMDVFIGRGGIKGQLDSFPEPVSDELLSGTGNRFADRTDESGLLKGNCPARQVSWLDIDGDGDLDLNVSCGRGTEPSFPNQVYRQDEDHRFADVAEILGLDFPSASVFAWLDSDSDNDLDLLSVEDGNLFHYLNLGGRFEKTPVGADLSGARPYKLAVADYDNDGDLDAFAVHSRKSFLVLNNNGRFALEAPASVGLPGTGRTANWVDFDNDGLLDLHVVPGGLYRQAPNHRFSGTDLLAHPGQADRIVDARSNWFDMDNDGYRDAVIAAQSGPTLWQRVLRKFAGRTPDLGDHWQTATFAATGPRENHWLQIELEGPAGNRQAIGARAYVSTTDGTQLQAVGGAEGSHFGQGHYRLYFGLASSDTASEVSVVWPDGTTRQLQNVPADQLLHVAYDETP